MSNNINTFIFDCFGVICDPLIYGWYNKNSVEYGFKDNELPQILQQFDLGNLGEDYITEYFSKYPGLNKTKAQIREEIDSNLKLNYDLIGVIKKLKQNGFKTLLLSNGNNGFFERKLYPTYGEFKNLFDEIIISSNIKMVKPNPAIFLYTLKKAGAVAENCLFTDDSETNVRAAQKLNLGGVVFTNTAKFIDDLRNFGVKLDS